jgi:hypothetical protein
MPWLRRRADWTCGGGRGCYRAPQMSSDGEFVSEVPSEVSRPPLLRLVWKNPAPPAPRKPLDLASAIERHLSGADGLTDEEFLRLFARRAVPVRPAWAEAAGIV